MQTGGQKEEQQLIKRLTELANLSYQRQIPVYTHFLNRNELHILHTLSNGWKHVRVQSFGGYGYAERQMAVFLPDAPFFEYDRDEDGGISYPFTALHIQPQNLKFAEQLSHRDYMGSIMNLGVDRSRLGDFIVKDQQCFLFCEDKIAEYIIAECGKVRHTLVTCSYATEEQTQLFTKPDFAPIKGSVASVRLDAVLALAFHTSRSIMNKLVFDGLVFVNGRLTQNCSHQLKDGDVVSARGYGKFIFDKVLSETKKSRYFVQILMFQ